MAQIDPLMSATPQDWQATCCAVCSMMADLVWPTVTPISVSADGIDGEALGSGTYLAIRGAPYLITADHVVEESKGRYLAHLLDPDENYVSIGRYVQRASWPVDVALVRVPWLADSENRKALSTSCLDIVFNPVDNELLFWLGFPGSTAGRHDPITEPKRRYSHFGTLHTVGVPMIVQVPREVGIDSPDFLSAMHVAVHYPTAAVRKAGEDDVELSNPEGMSGSLLWDTKFIQSRSNNIEWDPSMARVCGIVWGATNYPDRVLATKIEFVRAALLRFVQEEAAYYRWISRGCPLWAETEDWTWAEAMIPSL